MADNTKIEWTDATWNPITGCSVHSPGCTNCYAMQLAGTRLAHVPSRAGLTQPSKAGPVWTGEVRLNEDALTQPLRWRRPRMIFVCAHGDLFHENVPDEWIDRVFAVMALCPQHTFQVLTKRSSRLREYFRESTGWRARIAGLLNDLKPSPLWNGNVHQGWQNLHGQPDGLPNVWLGVSVEDQARADQRVPDLLATPAAVRWLSCEPLLGPVDLRWIAEPDDEKDGVIDALLGCNWVQSTNIGEEFRPMRPGHQDRLIRRWVCSPEADILADRKLDWIVVGGESGPNARPMHPDWARSLRDQCADAGVPFFFKQHGEWGPDTGPDDDYDRDGYRRDRVMEGAVPVRVLVDGKWQEFASGYAPPVELCFRPGEWVYRLGKKRNGRLLDGQLHDAMPQIGGVR